MVQIQKAARKNSAWVAIAGVALAACGDGSEHGDDATCAEFESTDPVVLDADVRLVAEGERQVQRELALDLFVADDSGVYWVDTTGALLAQRRGEADVVELLRDVVPSEGAASGQRVLGLAAGVDRLYIADGYFSPNLIDYTGIGDLSPPSRILSVPKQGGAATVLLESADRTLLPVAADAERIIVFAAGNESSWNEVSLSDPQLVPLALQPPSNSEVSGNAFHWSEHGNLMRAGFDDTAAEFVTRLRSDDFALGPDYFLSRQIDSNSVEQAVVHTLFLQGVDSECARVVPKTAPIISGTVSDPGYIYFYNSRNWDWSSPEGPRAEGELVRVDVTSGALARLQSPELTPELDFDIVGSDAESLYIASGDRLLAVRKP